MARIFDTIDQDLLGALRATLKVSNRSDFCVGYLNLRGWQAIDDLITPWDPAAGQVCRVLVGMQRPPHEEIRELYRQTDESGLIDNATASRLKTQFSAHLREQITLGIPTGQDEAGLRRLTRQLRAGPVVSKHDSRAANKATSGSMSAHGVSCSAWGDGTSRLAPS